MFSFITILIIRIYQTALSPLLHGLFGTSGCRFSPTCSQYTIESIQNFGVIRGIKMGISQLSRCHPFSSIK